MDLQVKVADDIQFLKAKWWEKEADIISIKTSINVIDSCTFWQVDDLNSFIKNFISQISLMSVVIY